MGRKREAFDTTFLPKYVYLSKGRYVYRPYDSKTKKKGREIVLCKDSASTCELLHNYAILKQAYDLRTLGWAIDKYLKSDYFLSLSSLSIRDGHKYAKQITQTTLETGELLGDRPFCAITRGVFQRYLDKRSRSAPMAGNKEITFLSTVYNWLIRRDEALFNPASEVKKNRVKQSTRYVSDEEYNVALNLAHNSGSPYIWAMMEISYICRAKPCEILKLTKDHISEKGLLLERAHNSKTQYIIIAERLHKALNACMANSSIESTWIVHNKYGKPITDSAYKSAWARLMKKFEKIGYTRFNFNDLKAKGISDFKGDKFQASGHRSLSERYIYDRKPEVVKATR